MRSRANFKAHPLHPALIPFPFAFLIGAFLFDVGALLFARPPFAAQTASDLTIAGVIAGLIAAIPGAIDYLHTVPPNSSGKKRATQHALLNVTALVLFFSAWLLRDNTHPEPSFVVLGLEFVGSGALAYSGWLGGTLVVRNLISVDHRYADKGQWQEASFTAKAGEPIVVGRVDDLKEDQMKLLHVNGRRIVLGRTKTGYVAFDDGCTHRGGSLAGGVLIDGTVQCLWHGSQFNVEDGRVRCGPAKEGISVHDVRTTKDGRVELVVKGV